MKYRFNVSDLLMCVGYFKMYHSSFYLKGKTHHFRIFYGCSFEQVSPETFSEKLFHLWINLFCIHHDNLTLDVVKEKLEKLMLIFSNLSLPTEHSISATSLVNLLFLHRRHLQSETI